MNVLVSQIIESYLDRLPKESLEERKKKALAFFFSESIFFFVGKRAVERRNKTK